MKQYKTRLTRWGFDRKNKKREDPALRKAQKRRPAAATSAGTAIDVHSQAARSNEPGTSHRGSTGHEDILQIDRSSGPAFARYIAAGLHYGRSATTPRSPLEQILSLIGLYVETSSVYGIWVLDSDNKCISTRCTPEDAGKLGDYHSFLQSAVNNFRSGSCKKARQSLAEAFALVDTMIQSADVDALYYYWDSWIYLIRRGYVDIAVMLIKYATSMADIRLHGFHPIVRMFTLLAGLDIAELELSIQSAWWLTVDAFQQQVPGLHPVCVRYQRDLIPLSYVYGSVDPAAAEQRLY